MFFFSPNDDNFIASVTVIFHLLKHHHITQKLLIYQSESASYSYTLAHLPSHASALNKKKSREREKIPFLSSTTSRLEIRNTQSMVIVLHWNSSPPLESEQRGKHLCEIKSECEFAANLNEK